MSIFIDRNLCDACGVCVDICPEDVFEMDEEYPKSVRENECWYCGACMMDCPEGAIEVIFPPHMRPVILKGTES